MHIHSRTQRARHGQRHTLKPRLLVMAVAAALALPAASASAQIAVEQGVAITGRIIDNSDPISGPFTPILLYSYNYTVSGNRITNSGDLESLNAEGIALKADDDDVVGNTIDNSGDISADTDGIYLYSYYDITGNTINNSGDITAGSDGIKLRSTGSGDDVSGNTVSNSGRISATLDGITLNADEDVIGNTVTNSGEIETNDDGISLVSEYGYEVGGNTVTNRGTIDAGYGIYLASDPDDGGTVTGNTVTNDGKVFSAYNALHLEGTEITGNTVTNRGTLEAYDDGDGIKLEAWNSGDYYDSINSGNTIINSGSIVASDDGIDLNSDEDMFGNLITNSGRIEAYDKGITLYASRYTAANTIDNAGLIVSDYDNFVAVRIAGEHPAWTNESAEEANNRLILRAPSYIAGEFQLERRSITDVSLISGPSHSVHWMFADTYYDDCEGECDDNYGANSFTTSGPLPWFHNPANYTWDNDHDEYATIDPSAFAAAPNLLADFSGMASRMANDALKPLAPTRNGLWVAARSKRMDYDGDGSATLDQDIDSSGFAAGYTRDIGNSSVGVMLGHGQSTLEVASLWKDYYSHSYDNEAKGAFAGVHGVAALGPVRLGLGLSGGRMSHDDKRFINDNLERDGQSYATASYDSTWYAPELSLSLPIALGASSSITPNVQGRYMVQKIDGYSERGSNADATVDKRTIKVEEVAAGIDFTHSFGRSSITASIGYLQRKLRGSDSVRVSMIGDTHEVPYFAQDLKAGFVGVNYALNLQDNLALNLSANYLSGSEGKGGSIGASLKMKF